MTLYRKVGPRKYEPVEIHECLRHFDSHRLLIAAARYYTGRMTIAASAFAEYELAKAWPDLPEGVRTVIRRDLGAKFAHDDEARKAGKEYLPLGHDCDRQAWERVREAWQRMESK